MVENQKPFVSSDAVRDCGNIDIRSVSSLFGIAFRVKDEPAPLDSREQPESNVQTLLDAISDDWWEDFIRQLSEIPRKIRKHLDELRLYVCVKSEDYHDW